MNRTAKQWFGCDPAFMAKQSEAAIMYAFKDAKADIAQLAAQNADLLNALTGIVNSLSEHDDEGMIEHATQMIAARAAIDKATKP